MSSYEAQQCEQIDRLKRVVDGFEAIFQGPDDGTVYNGNENLPTMAKLQKDAVAGLAEAVPAVAELVEQAEGARDAAQAAQEIAVPAAAAATTARDAALLSRGVYSSPANALSNGVASLASLVGGSGGTNGTFDLDFSGGGGTGAAGRFVVTGGAVVLTLITYTGHSYTGAPTVSFAASAGLTGASATAVIATNVDVGNHFSVPVVDSNDSLILYRVDAGPVAFEITRYSSAAAFSEIKERVDYDAVMREEGLIAVVDSNRRVLASVSNAGRWSLIQSLLNLDGGAQIYEYESLKPVVMAFVDSDRRIVSAIGGDDSPAEVQQARGTRSVLDERISQHLNAYGLPKQYIYGEWYLRETRQRMRKRLLGESAQLTVAMIGDSWTHARTRYTLAVATALMGAYGGAGSGWTGFGAASGGSLPNGNIDNTQAAVTYSGTWDYSAYQVTPSPDLGRVASSTAASKIAVTGQAGTSAIRLFWIGATGEIRYRFNAQAWVHITLDGSGLLSDVLAGIPVGAFTLELEVVSGTAMLCGLDIHATTDGVRVHKLGSTGSNASHWVGVDAAQWQAGLTLLAPNLVTILLGTNDQVAFTASAFKTNLQTIIGRIRTALPLIDICLIAPCENGRANTIPMTEFARVTYELAAEQKCAFLDLQYVFGETFSEYSSTSPRNWFNADLIHPEPSTGGRAIADAVTRLLTTL